MTTRGMTLCGRVQLIERRNEAYVLYDALILAMSMDQRLAGTRGEMAIDAVFVNPLRHLEEIEDWREALVRADGIVHISHADWIERRACLCYMEADDIGVGGDDLVAQLAGGSR